MDSADPGTNKLRVTPNIHGTTSGQPIHAMVMGINATSPGTTQRWRHASVRLPGAHVSQHAAHGGNVPAMPACLHPRVATESSES